MKNIFKIIATALVTSLFSAAAIITTNIKNTTPTPVEAASYSGYDVKVNFRVTNDADYWDEARVIIYTKAEHGRGGAEQYYTSGDFHGNVEYSGANHTVGPFGCGTKFPYCIQIKTTLGAFWQYHYGEADITVYINDINVASRHISYGGWDCETYYNNVDIDQTKFPYPVQKKINVDYSENVDPKDEATQLVKISATDQYGVKWTTPASSPITVHNESYPGEDIA